MKKSLVRMAIAGMMIAGVFSITGLAQGYRYYGRGRVENREAYQRARIREGIRNGSVTRSEAHKLYGEQRRIESYERRSLRDDGRLDRHEREHLDRMLDHSRRDIYHQKHDDEYYHRRRW